MHLKMLVSLLGRDIFFLKNSDTFSRANVRKSKMDAVARAHLIFELLTLQTKIYIPTVPVLKNLD